MKYLQTLLSKRFQSTTESYNYADAKQLLTSFMFHPATKIKLAAMKIAVIVNEFPFTQIVRL